MIYAGVTAFATQVKPVSHDGGKTGRPTGGAVRVARHPCVIDAEDVAAPGSGVDDRGLGDPVDKFGYGDRGRFHGVSFAVTCLIAVMLV